MSEPTIVVAYVPGHRHSETAPARAALATIEQTYPVLRIPCEHPTDYAAALIGLWREPGDLLIVEHDMAPTIEMIEDLLTCPRQACVQAYWLAPASTGMAAPLLSAWGEQRSALAGQVSQAAYSAIGLCKLGEALRQRTRPIGLVSWRDVEHEINQRVRGQWHLHWPVCPHHHGFSRGRVGHGRPATSHGAASAD